MGHQRLGDIPKSRKWRALIEEITGGNGAAVGDIEAISARTLEAAGPALQKSVNDPALQQVFWLLTQIAAASRTSAWREQLAALGLPVDSEASLFDLTARLQTAVDQHVSQRGGSTDVGEMAQQAAGEALVSLAGDRATTLFGGGGEHLQSAVRSLSTKAGFGRLGQVFFGRFLSRFLGFYLSRAAGKVIGTERLPSTASLTRFNDALELHCEQSALIVRDFCGQWYSKTEYLEGIDREKASRFMAVALRKLSSELARQESEA